MTVAADNVLARIVAHKLTEVAAAKSARPVDELKRQIAAAPRVRDFVAALRAAPTIGLIAEVKKASPSAGIIRADFDPVQIARAYEAAGASCLSVLTDEKFFQGHLDFLRAVRQAVGIPVLRKDFLIDPYQVLEARAAGADAVLLIAECLDDRQLRELYEATTALGMTALIEIYDPQNLDRVLPLNPPLVGVNNRDLRSFVTDLDQTLRIQPRVPVGTLLVSESGIKTRGDVERLRSHGVGAILVGETLMRSADIGAAVRELIG
ncbi:indole-3-glycerol phosphate synthase TrpC [Planctellipticum variicoloris]|jgi:indole-3-glycerol phosphate synthase|uniref:indole-3-glycerol phosphate synthase TrpC n=1 Tax=Planctellipticum variicoloris TaxID=3064265 RepID=UPI002C77C720|nr:indole-3-glycerol phosphate synthase TrpC [Planctomycetaceae bacterium SH412]HTN02013.1 indole-3-glycerol phosphate synthase TrpC [Planctomycetaceae bacterium]